VARGVRRVVDAPLSRNGGLLAVTFVTPSLPSVTFITPEQSCR